MNRREFLGGAVAGAALVTSRGIAAPRAIADGPKTRKPVLMAVGQQGDHSDAGLAMCAAFGVNRICSGLPSRALDENWSVEGLVRLKKHVESYGIALDCVPLPMTGGPIEGAEYPDILLARDPGRDRAIDQICQMIRNTGAAGIPLVKYNLSFFGKVRTGEVPGRGRASCAAFDYDLMKDRDKLTVAGRITADIFWDRIGYFLKRVVPVAEEANVKLALHPQDPGMPSDHSYRGVDMVLSTVAGLKRFVDTVPSAHHGLNFCQGTLCEMLPNPKEEIYDLIRYFGVRGKIFNVHFRNISGGYLKFRETFPDEGDIDMPRALQAYQEFGYSGMIMPDHVPVVRGDGPNSPAAFAFCFGYIQSLLQTLGKPPTRGVA